MMFTDREAAGTELARALSRQQARPNLVVGLARGGLLVARCVAERFATPLGVAVISVLRAPSPASWRLGAAASDGTSWVDQEIANAAGLDERAVEAEWGSAVARARWAQRQLGLAGRLPMTGRDVLLVDEGLAWPGRAVAAARWARRRGAARVWFAVPVATPPAMDALTREVDWLTTLGLDPAFTGPDRAYHCCPPVDLAAVYALAHDHDRAHRPRRPANVRRHRPAVWRSRFAIAS